MTVVKCLKKKKSKQLAEVFAALINALNLFNLLVILRGSKKHTVMQVLQAYWHNSTVKEKRKKKRGGGDGGKAQIITIL